MFPGLLFLCLPIFQVPSLCLQEALFLPTLIGSCHSLFIHSQGKDIPAHVAFPAICILSLSHSDAESQVT